MLLLLPPIKSYSSLKPLAKDWQPGQHVDMSMLFALSHDHTSCPGCHFEEKRLCNEGELVQWYMSLAHQSTSLTFHSQTCYITYRYGLGQAGDRIHFLEDDGIGDLLASEEGDCNVSDFCRVSIVEPAITQKVESISQAVKKHEAHDLKLPAGSPLVGSWTCSECGASNSGLTPDMCPVCGSER